MVLYCRVYLYNTHVFIRTEFVFSVIRRVVQLIFDNNVLKFKYYNMPISLLYFFLKYNGKSRYWMYNMHMNKISISICVCKRCNMYAIWILIFELILFEF